MSGSTPDLEPAGEAPELPVRARRRRWLVWGVPAAILVVAGALAAALSTSGSGGNVLTGATGGPAPAFSLSDLAQPDRTVTLAQLEGTDLVVNFWASWCFPCQQEMPVLQAEAAALGGRVRFVGIDANDTRDAALAFLRKVHVGYTTLFDGGGTVAASYGLFGLPTTVFISPTGTLLGEHRGQLDAQSLHSALAQAFGSKVLSG